MPDPIPEATRRLVDLAGADPDETQAAMQARAEAGGFPIIGPAVGGLLEALATLTDARRVFEFGSGFGYSASWAARGMTEGEVVLTDVDADELDEARGFLEDAGYAPSFAYEHGDAVEVVERHDGPFDLVLVDHEKHRYVEGFERVRGKVAPGGVVVADNMLRGPLDHADVLAGLEGEATPDEATAGVVAYLERVRDDAAFAATLVPLGNGVSVAVRRR